MKYAIAGPTHSRSDNVDLLGDRHDRTTNAHKHNASNRTNFGSCMCFNVRFG